MTLTTLRLPTGRGNRNPLPGAGADPLPIPRAREFAQQYARARVPVDGLFVHSAREAIRELARFRAREGLCDHYAREGETCRT